MFILTHARFFGVTTLVTLTLACSSEKSAFDLAASNPTEASKKPLFACYGRGDFDLCIPSISKGKRPLIRSAIHDKTKLAEALSRRDLHLQAGTTLISIDDPQSEAEKALRQEYPDSALYELGSFLPRFVQQSFNTSAYFSGPNCYNTALATVGILPPSPVRHVSLAEFDLYLEGYFDKVGKPESGDLVVYNEQGPHDHVAFYLFDDLVFHKKGYKRGYGYRITEMDRVYQAEPFEWRPFTEPGMEDAGPTKVTQTKNFFRYRGLRNETKPSATEDSMIKLIDYLTQVVIQYANQRNLAEHLGTLTEYLVKDLQRHFFPLRQSPSFASRLAYARLSSLSDQIFEAFEETLYSSPLAEPAMINKRFCFQDNKASRELFGVVFSYLHKRPATDSEMNELYQKRLSALDRGDCRMSIQTMWP